LWKYYSDSGLADGVMMWVDELAINEGKITNKGAKQTIIRGVKLCQMGYE